MHGRGWRPAVRNIGIFLASSGNKYILLLYFKVLDLSGAILDLFRSSEMVYVGHYHFRSLRLMPDHLFLKNSISHGSSGCSDTSQRLVNGSSSLELRNTKCHSTIVFESNPTFRWTRILPCRGTQMRFCLGSRARTCSHIFVISVMLHRSRLRLAIINIWGQG